uniref:Uncharacterized protein n=1 Tax=Ceratitis capitata TaxID=7213 RepID=W8BCL3_CERCA
MSANNTTIGTTIGTTIATTKSPYLHNVPTNGTATVTPINTGIIIYSDYWYWDEMYYIYVVLLVLVCFGLAFGAYARSKRLAEQKRIARLRAQGSGNVCTPPNNSECPNAAMPRCDNPPTYESAMANYIDAKQQLRAMEEGAVAGAMAMTASTTTIETCVTDVESSRTDLRAPNVVEIAPTGSISVNLTSEETKPPLQ